LPLCFQGFGGVGSQGVEGGGIAEPLRHGVKGGLSRAGEDGSGGGVVEIDGGHDVTSFSIKISLIVVVWGGVVKGVCGAKRCLAHHGKF